MKTYLSQATSLVVVVVVESLLINGHSALQADDDYTCEDLGCCQTVHRQSHPAISLWMMLKTDEYKKTKSQYLSLPLLINLAIWWGF